MNRAEELTKRCAYCNKEFKTNNINKKYCSCWCRSDEEYRRAKSKIELKRDDYKRGYLQAIDDVKGIIKDMQNKYGVLSDYSDVLGDLLDNIDELRGAKEQ